MSARPAAPALSKNHRLVYDIVQEQGVGTHLAMAQLFALARARRPTIGFTTVYRALSRLRDLGLVSEIAIPGAERAYYEPAGEPHAHFRCERCGCVEDVRYALPAALANRLASEHGFTVSRADVSLHGRCRTCRQAPAEAN